MSPLPMPALWAAPLPDANPPAGMALYQLPTGTYETRAALAVQGGSFRDKRHFAATAVLVHHPKGDLLIDAGFGSGVAAHVASLPRYARPLPGDPDVERAARRQRLGPHPPAGRAADPLPSGPRQRPGRAAAADLDHCGRAAVRRGGPEGQGLPGRVRRPEIHKYDLDGPQYLGFASSYDVHGDGSAQLSSPSPAATPPARWSVFAILPSGQRYAFIGALTWQCDGIHRRVERPWLLSKLADSDPEQLHLAYSR